MRTINEKTFNKVANLVIFGFSVFNLVVSWNLFATYTDNENLKYVYSGLGVLWDLFLLINLVLLKTAIKLRKGWNIFGYLLSYALVLSIGFVGSIGFNIASVKHQTEVVSNLNKAETTTSDTITADKNAVVEHNSTIASYNIILKGIDLENASKADLRKFDDYTAKKNSELKAVEALNLKIQENSKIITDAAAKPVDLTVKKDAIKGDDVFESVGHIVGLPGSTVRDLTFILLILMIHVGLFVTTPTLNTKTEIKGLAWRKVNAFIDALFDVTGARLANDNTISVNTNLELKEVQEIRKFLLGLPHYKNEAILYQGRGIGTKASVSKDVFKTLVRVHLDSGE
jgi:hypothetical protein